jgi:hypothetical protein
MHELKLDHRPRIADEGTLERSIGGSIAGGPETSSSAGSLGIHIVTILEHPAERSFLAGKIW